VEDGEKRNIHNDMMNAPAHRIALPLWRDLREHMRVIEPALEAIMISSTGFNSIAFFLRIPTPTRKLHFLACKN